MKQRKQKLKNIKRSAVLLQQLTQSFKLGMDKGSNNTAKKGKFIFTDSIQEEMMKQIERRLSKGTPNVDMIAKLTEDIYERIGHRYQQNKTIGHVINQTHSRVVGGGRPRSYVPHATVRVRLDKKTGQYEMNIWAPKTDFREERVGKVNGTLKVDQKLKDRLKEKIQSDTRNFLANENKLDKENEESTPRYENIQKINSFSVTKDSTNEGIKKIPSKKTEMRARRVGRPTLRKSVKITRAKRSSRKGRPTRSRHITTRTRKLSNLKSEEILKEVSTMKIYSKESIEETKLSITQQPGKKGELLRKNLDKQIKMLFKQTQAMQEKGSKVNTYRPQDFSVLDNIEKEIGSIAANWPDNLRKTTLRPNYAEHTIKVDRFTVPTKSEFYTPQMSDYIQVKTSSIKPTIQFNKDTQTFSIKPGFKTKIQTTIRPKQKETISPTVRRMVDRHFTYLPRVFTFHPITIKSFVPTTRRRYIFTPKFIYDTEEDSISDSDITRAPLHTMKHKTKKQTKVLYTSSTVKPTTSIVKSIKPKLSSTSRVMEDITIKSLLDTILHVRSSTIVPTVKSVVTKSTKFLSATDFPSTKQLPTVKEIKINVAESITETTNLFINDITQQPFDQTTTEKQPHYFTYGTVRGGFKQYDGNWWKLNNRNRGRGPHSRFAQPLHLRGKTFSQRPLRSFNRNKPFNSVRTFLSGIRKASSDMTEKDTQSDLSTLVPFLQSKIRKFYENTPVSLKKTIRPYYNIRLHPMNPVDSVEHSTLSSTEDQWTRNDLFTPDESPPYTKTIENTTSIDELMKRKRTPASSMRTPESDETVQEEEYTTETKPESTMDTSSKVKDRIHIRTAISSDELNTISQLVKTTVKSKIKITSSVDKKIPRKLNKPKIISVFSSASSYKLPTSVPVPVFPKLTTTKFSWPTYKKETKPPLTEKSVSSEETPSTESIVSEIVKTTENLPMEAHTMTEEWISKVLWPTYKLSSIQHSIKPNFTTRRSSTSSYTVKLKEKLLLSTAPTKTPAKTKFKFVWPTKKVGTTQALKITTAPTFLLSTSLPTTRTTQPEITIKMTTSVLPTNKKIKTYSTVNPEIFDNSYAKLVWPTFKLPTTSQLISTTENLIPTLQPARTQSVSTFTTDKPVPIFTLPPSQTPDSETVIPKLTTEMFIPRAVWPTFQRHYTFRPKRVMRNYKNPRWIVRPQKWPHSNQAFRARSITKFPNEEMRGMRTYRMSADLAKFQPTTDSEILTYSESSQQIDKTDETSETTDPNYVTTEKPKILLTTVKKTAPEMLWPPYQTERTVEPIVSTYKTMQSTFKQSAPEMKWPPYQETSTLQTKTNKTSKRTVNALDSAQYPDLDEYLLKTTHLPITTSAPHNRTKTHPTKWWVNYIYPDLYRKHVVDSSFENYSDKEDEDDYTILPFDHNTTGTPYYSKLRFGGTWYTFRPVYIRPTTPEPPTTTELTTPSPTTKPTPKRTRIHHIIKKGFKKIFNIFSFGKRRKQNEEVSE